MKETLKEFPDIFHDYLETAKDIKNIRDQTIKKADSAQAKLLEALSNPALSPLPALWQKILLKSQSDVGGEIYSSLCKLITDALFHSDIDWYYSEFAVFDTIYASGQEWEVSISCHSSSILFSFAIPDLLSEHKHKLQWRIQDYDLSSHQTAQFLRAKNLLSKEIERIKMLNSI